MTLPESIPAFKAIELLVSDPATLKCLDVRSEGEVLKGVVPKFINIPILNNQERHEVGICYKNSGSDKAVELGHKLVDGHRVELVKKWREHLEGTKWPLVTCWRGGLRSQIAAEWIRNAGGKVIRIEHGYKSMRHELQKCLEEAALPPFYVVSGPTGSGKTKLIEESKIPQLNLERMACHRGSAFGAFLSASQPRQGTFENEIAIELLKLKKHPHLFVEDESVMIGHLRLPSGLNEKMRQSPIVKLKVSLEERVENILQDYVITPLETGTPSQTLSAHYELCLGRIETRLGGQMHGVILKGIKEAFANSSPELHRHWIGDLLKNYYDKMYLFSETRWNRKIIFEGDWQACLSWMQKQLN